MTTPEPLPGPTIVDDYAIVCQILGGTPDDHIGALLVAYSLANQQGRMDMDRIRPDIGAAWDLWMTPGGPRPLTDYIEAARVRAEEVSQKCRPVSSSAQSVTLPPSATSE